MEGGGENIKTSVVHSKSPPEEPAKYSAKVILLTSPVRMSDFTF